MLDKLKKMGYKSFRKLIMIEKIITLNSMEIDALISEGKARELKINEANRLIKEANKLIEQANNDYNELVQKILIDERKEASPASRVYVVFNRQKVPTHLRWSIESSGT